MNKQNKGNGERGIEWTDFSWNPIAGCRHACQWTMPDGSIANCYAEDVAEGVASAAYPDSFEAHYWNPGRLDEPGKVQTPSKIFVGSMADVFGWWVPLEQQRAILDVCKQVPQHTFQFLTKNPVGYHQFVYPENVWLGMSTPPDFMWGKKLSVNQKYRMFSHHLRILQGLDAITWLSAEPLSWDITPVLHHHRGAIDWIVIGAASNGRVKYAPNREHVRALVALMDTWNVPVFFKGNMKSLPWAREHWREEFPVDRGFLTGWRWSIYGDSN